MIKYSWRMAHLKEETNQNAHNHVEFLKFTLEIYGKGHWGSAPVPKIADGSRASGMKKTANKALVKR